MNDKDTIRLEIWKMLFSVAIGLIVASTTFIVYAFKKPSLGPAFWILFGIGMAALFMSCILGSKGASRIPNPGNLFNLQALCCAAGFFLLAISFIFLAKPTENNTVISIIGLPKDSEQAGHIVQILDIEKFYEIITRLEAVEQDLEDLQKKFSKKEVVLPDTATVSGH